MQRTTPLELEQHRLELGTSETVTAILYRANEPRAGAALALAHGAGAGQTSQFMRDSAVALAQRGIDVLTFNFPYMEAKRRMPDRADKLEACFQTAIETMRGLAWPGDRLFIGGKSMGGRIASHVAARAQEFSSNPAGLVILGYPLHPPGKPGQLRTAHLATLDVPVLIVQGTRDPFGTPEELGHWFTGPKTLIYSVEGGDHSFKVPRKAGRTQDQVMSEIQDVIRDWMGEQAGR